MNNSGIDTNTLELIRKTLYGGSTGGLLDFNSVFSGINNQSLNLLGSKDIFSILNGGETAPNDAIGNAPASAQQGIAAAIGVVGQAMMGMVGVPGLSTAVNGITGLPSALQGIQNAFNSFANPEGIATNQSGLTPQAIEGFVTDSGDSGDAPDTGSASPDGSGVSAGNAGDADGGTGSADGPDSGNYFHGGIVPGPSTGQDKVNINVDGGEGIIPAEVMKMLGTNFFEKLLLTKSPLQEAAEKAAASSAKKG